MSGYMTNQVVANAFAARKPAAYSTCTSTGTHYYLHGETIAEWVNPTTVQLYRPAKPTEAAGRHLTAIATAVSGTPCTINKAVLDENDAWTISVRRSVSAYNLLATGETLVNFTVEAFAAPDSCGLTDALIALRVWADEKGYDFDAADSASLTAASKIGRGEPPANVLFELHAFHVGD